MKNKIINKRIIDSVTKDIKIDDEYSKIIKNGLSKEDVTKSTNIYGKNILNNHKKDNLYIRIRRSFFNPFSIVLLILSLISLFTDIIFAKNERNYATFIIILTMLFISGFIRLFQEIKSKKITDKLDKFIDALISVKRENEWVKLPFENLVVGDVVKLNTSSVVPADLRIISSTNLLVSQSAITGESRIIEKNEKEQSITSEDFKEYTNILFQGSTIINGQCEAIVLAVGKETLFGGISPSFNERKKGFDKGSNKIIWILIQFMAILSPLVFIVSGITNGDWLASFLFSLSVAIGITPELLPMVVTSCLSKGSYSMSKKQTIVKNINAMESFGRMDTICIDKTGTLTEDELKLEYFINILGNEDQKVLDYVALNSYFSKGVPNHLDNAILNAINNENTKDYYNEYFKQFKEISVMPFDYERKISSVVLNKDNSNILICKGDVDKIINLCDFYEFNGEIKPINENKISSVHQIIDDMLEDGMKVIAVATKNINSKSYTIEDEKSLILIGYVVFFDAPKKTAKTAIEKLQKQNVNIKILTGDNLQITLSICKRLNINYDFILTGNDIENLNDEDIHLAVEKATVFAELTPKQKSKIVECLENNGHVVGFLGDGINDLPAMVSSDVSLCVDSASPSLKEISDVVLLKKDLNVLEEGILEGRKAFANMNKYIQISASSNFGNIISIIISSIFLPFFPMTSIQILLLNLLYDIICLVLPRDNVDKETCTKPLEWSGNTLKRFMLFFGPISTIFDILTFIFLFYYLCPTIAGGSYSILNETQKITFMSVFQTGFFLESMWTQIMILHILRTKHLSLIKNKPSKSVFIVTLLGIVIFTTIAMTPLGELIGLSRLPIEYFLFLIAVVISYSAIITLAKIIYVKKYNKLI